MKTQTSANCLPVRVVAGLIVGLATIASVTGCVTQSSRHEVATKSAKVQFEPWAYRDKPALSVRSEHYVIHTTIDNTEFLKSLSVLMESALEQYQELTPGVAISEDPMECFMFARRPDWAEFTAAKTGADAALYLQINRGGYTVRDWYVAYYIGEIGTYAVAAHEGWHQYVARHFRSRLPPFLEEGIATMFENVRFYDTAAPQWDLSPNSNRATKLRAAVEGSQLWPLEQLITMHAGEVVSLPGSKIEAFYAQNWAFAEFLWNAEDGKYRAALQRLLKDAANGTIYDSTGSARRSVLDSWDPKSVKPMLEHYLCMDLDSIDREYQAYIRKIAYTRVQ